MRVIIGLVKGLIVGGAVGYGLLRLGWTSGALAYVACAIVGAGIGVGLAALGTHFGPDTEVFVKPLHTGLDQVPFRSGPILAPIIGVIYGIFVEWDDGGAKKEPPAKKPDEKKSA